jgi:hypothetical protein
MTRPVRLRLSRAKGFNLQEHSRATNGLEAVVVTRGPGKKYGNPFRVTDTMSAAEAVAAFRSFWPDPPTDARHLEQLNAIRLELRGMNLACWCALDAPCHADVLLEIANRPICERVR